jgi:hypothetical protein
MTLPDERYRAVMHTRIFLLELCNPEKTPRVPAHIRQTASWLLRHYPSKFDLDQTADKVPEVFQERMEDVTRLFKQYEESKKDET